MASMKDIKRRKSSVQSTQQITKAMKLVSTVKLQKARTNAENANPFFNHMYETITSILKKSQDIDHPYLKPSESERVAVIVITANRGLAGGYNSNIIKMVMGMGYPKEMVDIYAIGTKGRDGLQSKGYQIAEDFSNYVEGPTYEDARVVAKHVLADYTEGKIGQIHLVYTHFKNTVVHIPTALQLLPVQVEDEEETGGVRIPMNFEPSEEEVLEQLIPKYITSLIYGALVEAVASENGARMQAMDSATSNAEEIISDLSLKYNRARQGAITQELTEIIAGASAIS